MKNKSNLTEEQKNAALRLKLDFKRKKPLHGLTYEKAGAALGWSPSNITQYLNAHIPLNMSALLRICSLIDANAVEIYPEIFEDVDTSTVSTDEKLVSAFNKMPKEMQDAIMKMILLNSK